MSRHRGGFDWTTLSLFFLVFAAGVAFGTLAFFGALLAVGLNP